MFRAWYNHLLQLTGSKTFPSLQKKTPYPLSMDSPFSPEPQEPPVCFQSLNLPLLDISCRCNHTGGLLSGIPPPSAMFLRCTLLVACISTASVPWLSDTLFSAHNTVHSSSQGTSGLFPALTVVNSAAVYVPLQNLFESLFLPLFGKYLKPE